MAQIQVTTWQEFVTACATSGADVVVAENTVWDMNQIAPAGAPTVTVACNSISGNGSAIKSASVISQPLIKFTNAATVTRLNISDFTADTSVIAGTAIGALWKMSDFSGVQNAGNTVSTSMTFCEDSDALVPKGCGFNIQLSGGGFYGTSGTATLRNCKAHFGGTGTLNGGYIQLDYSFVYGSFTSITLNSYCKMSLINSPNKRGVVAGAAAQWNPFVDCTDAQLRDTSYLNSIGFTCGVVS